MRSRFNAMKRSALETFPGLQAHLFSVYGTALNVKELSTEELKSHCAIQAFENADAERERRQRVVVPGGRVS